MLASLYWWLSIQAMGLAALPLALRWLRWLPDRGYFLAKPLGILLISYVLWVGATFGVIDNTATTVAMLTAAAGAVFWLLYRDEARSYLSTRWRLVLGVEALFAAAFALWTLVRAYDPAIAATEKPMEIAFLSATMRSLQFPPVDPWLAGYGISYYYFGYVIVNALAKLAAVDAPVAFNLAIAALFALTAVGAFTIAHNLASSSRIGRAAGRAGEGLSSVTSSAAERSEGSPRKRPGDASRARHDIWPGDTAADPPSAARTIERPRGAGAVVCGLFASFLLVISGNLEPVFELLNARGILSPAFSRWLAIKDMPAPYAGAGWLPLDNWWWFRATRVIGDFDPVTNVSRDYTINEFPFFSFTLGDLHPHLLALPFAVLALAVALNLILSGDKEATLSLRQRPVEWGLLGLVFGALGFLNSWDLPTYLLVLSLAYGVYRYRLGQRIDGKLVGDVLGFGGLVLAASIVLYLPFYIGFRSQAMGLGLVGVRSKLHHFAIFWGPLFFLLLSWIVLRVQGDGFRAILRAVRGSGREGSAAGPGSRRAVILAAAIVAVELLLVLSNAAVAALLLALGLACAFAFWHQLRRQQGQNVGPEFVWLLCLTALFLLFVCEWVFIRDLFNNRMNTVFKFYFQSWLLLAVAGSYVLYSFASRLLFLPRARGAIRYGAWWLAAALVLVSTLLYPVTATWSKTNGFSAQPTLDGQAFEAMYQPADDEAIRWLRANVRGTPVILEATGGSYGPAGRVSAFTGLPTVLGWDFHEQQWRGSYAEQGQRKADVEAIYSSPDRSVAETLLRKYGVTYVYVGPLERELYGKLGPAVLEKFGSFMQVAHRNNGVVVYRINDQGSERAGQAR